MVSKYGMKWIVVGLLACATLAMPLAGQAQVERIDHARAAAAAGIRTAGDPGSGYLWTPGYWAYGPEGYFWVPGTWVQPPDRRAAVDPGLLGLVRRAVHVEHGLLGPAGRLLWRRELWLRLRRPRLRGRLLAKQPVLLQPQSHAHQQCAYHERLQQDGREQRDGAARELRRRPGRSRRAPTAQEQQAAHVQHVPPDLRADPAPRERRDETRAPGEREPGQAADRRNRQAGDFSTPRGPGHPRRWSDAGAGARTRSAEVASRCCSFGACLAG